MPNKEELLAFIRRSKRRKDVLKLLSNKAITATDIERQIGMYKSHISRAILELKDKGLVECKNPNDRAFRYYKITTKGKAILVKTENSK